MSYDNTTNRFLLFAKLDNMIYSISIETQYQLLTSHNRLRPKTVSVHI